MDTKFINSENSKTSNPHKLFLNLTSKTDLRTRALSNISIYYTWKTIKKSHKNNKVKTSAPTCTDKFQFTDGSYFISDIQDFEYIIKKQNICQ